MVAAFDEALVAVLRRVIVVVEGAATVGKLEEFGTGA